MKCFYHNDMDGHCSGAIVAKYFQSQKIPKQFYCIDYKDPFPFDDIEEAELVILVDYSLKSNDFEKLLEITRNIIWIDHHQSAIESLPHISRQVDGIQEVTPIAACGLTWKHFFEDIPRPHVVKLLGDYDTWTYNYGDQTRFFQLGCQIEDTHPESPVWDKWLCVDYDPREEIQSGELIKKFTQRRNTEYIKSWAFEAEFEGYKAVCCNKGGPAGSVLFDSIKDSYDLVIPFVWTGDQWRVSVFTEKDEINCAALAGKYGGGGHLKAAGFQVKKLPFKKVKKI